MSWRARSPDRYDTCVAGPETKKAGGVSHQPRSRWSANEPDRLGLPSPLRRIETRKWCRSMVSPPDRRTLMGLLALRRFVCSRPAETSGSPQPASASSLSRRAQRFFFDCRPPHLSEAGSFSRELSLPCRVLPFACLPHPCSRVKRLPWGFVPLRDIDQAQPRCGIPRPRTTSVLGVSHALDGLLRPWPCGFVSPRCHVQGSPFRGLPPGEAVPSRRRPVPSSLAGVRCTTVARNAPLASAPPSGLALHRDPLLRRRGLIADAARSPPELHLLQVLPLLAVGAPSRSLRPWS
jgi:hypothetical protein